MSKKIGVKVSESQYKFCLIKSYFDKGYGLTHYFFKLIAIFGLTSNNIPATMWMVGIYTLMCFVIGYSWYKSGFIYAEAEVGNRFNMFQQEMRSKFGTPNNRKT